MTYVVVCDPPSRLRDALAQRICEVPGVDRIEIVDDVASMANLLAGPVPEVVLLASQPADVRPSVAVRYVRAHAPAARILVLTMGTDPDDVVAGIAAGAVGYLARDAVLPEVAAALAMIPPTRRSAGSGQSGQAGDAVSDEPFVNLTDRELQVLEGMSRGRSNSEIGDDLFLSEDTIKTHARRLFRKMRVRDRAHAVAEGFRRGLLR